MARSEHTNPPNPGAVVLGLLWLLGGVLLAAAGLMELVPSLYALGAIALVVGVLGLAGASLPTTTITFWSALVPGALLVAIGAVLVRFPTLEPSAVALLAAVVFLGAGIVRLGAAREFATAWRPLLVSGLVSCFLGLVVVAEVLAPTASRVAFLLGCDLLVGGIVLVRTARR